MDESGRIGNLRERWSTLTARAAAAAERAGRRPAEVLLLAVTKTVSIAEVRDAASAGARAFGESYVQEADAKFFDPRTGKIALSDGLPELHLIGRLQRNKARRAVALFDVIHTVDRPELAAALAKEAAAIGKRQDVLLQVNISEEPSKGGALPSEMESLMEQTLSHASLRICGLMAIGSYVSEDAPDDERRREFRLMRGLRDGLSGAHRTPLPHLSMGMSADFELAIEEGATIVRVGTALFGERDRQR